MNPPLLESQGRTMVTLRLALGSPIDNEPKGNR